MKDRRKIERKTQQRIKKNFQSKFLRLIVITLVSFTVLSMVAFYVALRIKVEQAGFSGYTEERLAEVFTTLNWVLPLIGVILIVIAVVVAKKISFKVAGPLYALEKQLHLLVENKIDRVQLRSDDDEMVPFAHLLNELIMKKENPSNAEKKFKDV